MPRGVVRPMVVPALLGRTARVGEGMLEDLDLLEQRERVEVGGEVHHQPVLDVEKDVARHAVVPHEGVEGVALRHPLDEARVGREGQVHAHREVMGDGGR